MQECQTIQPRLSEYVDGMLDEEMAWKVKMHLSTCAVCAKVAGDFTATASLLRSLPQAEPSANFEAMLAQRLADHVLKPERLSPWERLRNQVAEWWALPGVRPAFAGGAAVAMVVPVAILTTIRTIPTLNPAPVALASPASESETLNELWDEHRVYASSLPLSDRAALTEAASLVDSL